MNKRVMEKYCKLKKTERIVWILLMLCLFLLFQLGIDIEYEHINTVTIRVLHTVVVVASIVFGVVQYQVITRATELEEKYFNK